MLARMSAHAGIGARYKPVEEIARGSMGTVLAVWDEPRQLACDEGDPRRRRATTERRDAGEPRSASARAISSRSAGHRRRLDHPRHRPRARLGRRRSRRGSSPWLVRGTRREGVRAQGRGRLDDPHARAGRPLRVCEAMAVSPPGVIHRDLKPANVMVGRFGEVYVMDWGLARVLGQRGFATRARAGSRQRVRRSVILTDRASERARTSAFAAPDDGRRRRRHTRATCRPSRRRARSRRSGPRSDVYAVGAMLYHLLVGEMPVRAERRGEHSALVWARVLSGPPQSDR